MRYRIFEWIDTRTHQGAWSATYDSLGAAGQAAADTRVLYLRDQPPSMWVDPHAKKLSSQRKRKCKDIYEIRFKANNVQQRPLGYFGPDPGTFTVVLWATHKGNQWTPKEFCRIASERWANIKAGAANTAEIEVD